MGARNEKSAFGLWFPERGFLVLGERVGVSFILRTGEFHEVSLDETVEVAVHHASYV